MTLSLNIEDVRCLYAPWVSRILEIHTPGRTGWKHWWQAERVELQQHVVMGGLEVDAYLTVFFRENGHERPTPITVLCELKEDDCPEVAHQALARRHLADYCYVVVDQPSYIAMENMKREIPGLLSRGVGIVSARDGSVIFRSRLEAVLGRAPIVSRLASMMEQIQLPEPEGEAGGRVRGEPEKGKQMEVKG